MARTQTVLQLLRGPRVVLLGAGASRGGLADEEIPPPTDAQFFSVANQLTGHGTPVLAKRVLSSVWELFARVDGVGLEEYYRDVETRAAIGRIAKAVGKPKEWAKRKADLEELIRRVYVHTTTRKQDEGREPAESAAHAAILRSLMSGDTVLTFNYDLVIEESMPKGIRWSPRDGYGTNLAGVTKDWPRRWLEKRGRSKSDESDFLLLKLHGSLGWSRYKNGEIRLKPRPYQLRKGKPESVSVLPPGWNKRIDLNPYRMFWRKARLRLQACKSLVIVGYSLPETDLLARALFAEVVRIRNGNRNYINYLVIVDPDVAVRRKLLKLFTPALGPLCKIWQYDELKHFAPSGEATPSNSLLQQIGRGRRARPRNATVRGRTAERQAVSWSQERSVK